MTEQTDCCPTCGGPVIVHSSDEGTHGYVALLPDAEPLGQELLYPVLTAVEAAMTKPIEPEHERHIRHLAAVSDGPMFSEACTLLREIDRLRAVLAVTKAERDDAREVLGRVWQNPEAVLRGERP